MNTRERIGLISALMSVAILSWLPSTTLHELTHVWQSPNVKVAEICFLGWNSTLGPAWVSGWNLLQSEVLPAITFFILWISLLAIGFWLVVRKL